MRLINAFAPLLLIVLAPLPPLALADNGKLTFKAFFEERSMPTLIIDVESGKILQANKAADSFYSFEQLEGMDIDSLNMLTPQQIEEERRRAATSERNHLFFRHRVGNGQVKLIGVYTDHFELDGRDVLISSLYDTSDFDPVAERHYIERVQEQVDIQTAQLQSAQSRQFWLALIGGTIQAAIIVVLLVVLVRLRRSNQENKKLLSDLSFRNHELERLGHVMAHHFQEPSRRLVSFSQQISQKLGGDNKTTVGIAAGFIQDQAKRLSHLVLDVQRYLSLDHLPPKMEMLDPATILEHVYQSDRLLTDMRQAHSLHITSPLPGVYFDARRLELIFQVLLHNCWMYRHPDRSLRVEVTAAEVDGRVRFCIADNGSGIAPEYREQVLELFSRLVPNTDSCPGTGMGLALVIKALRPADGHLWIGDGIDGGTAVHFHLPAHR